MPNYYSITTLLQIFNLLLGFKFRKIKLTYFYSFICTPSYPFSITSLNVRCINNISQCKQIIFKGQEVLPKNVGGDHLERGSQTASMSFITFIMGRVFPATYDSLTSFSSFFTPWIMGF